MSAQQTITLPDIGDFNDVPVIELLVAPGDRVKVDDLILALESDKATIEVPSPMGGVVSQLLVQVGTKVSRGSPLMILEMAGASGDPAPPPANGGAPKIPAPAAPVPDASVVASRPGSSPSVPGPAMPAAAMATSDGAHATPSVRQYARELGVDLSRVVATGPKKRILKEDVQAFVKGALVAGPDQARGSGTTLDLPDWPKVDFTKFGEIERVPLSRIQKLSGGNLARNWVRIPHVTNFDHADVTEIEAFRTQVNAEKRNDTGKLTMVAFLIKASASALRAYPRFNSSLDGEDLIFKKYVHVGFAADTPNGLVVPVIRDADRKGVLEIATEMGEMAGKAREGRLPGTDMQGGTFTVSSLGGVGGDGFTPIINAPEVAILGAGRSSTGAVWRGSAFEPRLIMPISLSWDHRVVDGVAAARFLGHVAALLADFRRAVL
ncbi:2-oxo acid dehydrogenase subunit E2 [Xanthobacter dioxanivorans]|uniref:Dihydrolipoamide acetyltransferase component of pyruvate dehydrogenase complex n=1 Tax=Xanthobacter dioxanivorans TaxID=2528964 RepID=A0A974SJ79_9HYPH|nr:2-oxo acid dehydrogenase subunit E2 [Xanthobacter dioxanivorans]QRG07237.1 2-oxo acid dehydrogenase subunit E2 [Xanthobacter dioxanivorans]